MKLVIDIPEDVYAEACVEAKREVHPHQDYRWIRILRSICNGTPLPKGHGRLKDADELLRYIESMQSWLNENGYRMIRRIKLTDYIQGSLPTIIEADKVVNE